jgi:hypothetical protein
MPNDKTFPIETGVPFPGKQKTAAGRPSIYPFSKLEVNQSFFVASERPTFSSERTLCAAYHKARETMGHNFAWAREEGGFRIFRLPGEAVVKKHRPREVDERAA